MRLRRGKWQNKDGTSFAWGPWSEVGNKSCQLSAISYQQKVMKDLKDLPLFLQTSDFCLPAFPAVYQNFALLFR